jgi:hypothetical protein
MKKTKRLFFSMDVDNVEGSQLAIQPLIDFSKKESLDTSFFITGRFAEMYPIETKLIFTEGYDIGIHGWDHGIDGTENFRTNSYKEQKHRIRAAIDAIKNVTGVRPLINRCPDLWVSETTIKVLTEEGILLDSSVPAKRLVGRIRSLKYLLAPSEPYFPSFDDIGTRGDQSSILELPPSAFLLPINLSALRYFGLNVMKLIVRLYSLISDNIVFYGHPAEYLRADQIDFGDENVASRHINNIGPHIYSLTKELVDYTKSLGFESQTISALIDERNTVPK